MLRTRFVAGCIAALLLAGCGDDSSESLLDTNDTSGDVEVTEPQDSEPTTTAAEADEPTTTVAEGDDVDPAVTEGDGVEATEPQDSEPDPAVAEADEPATTVAEGDDVDPAVTEDSDPDPAVADGDEEEEKNFFNLGLAVTFDVSDDDLSVEIPAGTSPPETVVREDIVRGVGQPVPDGSAVMIEYEMREWASGEIVEATRDFPEKALQVVLGAGVVPVALDAALVGTTAGTVFLITFPSGTEDLPPYLNQDETHVLIVRVLAYDDPVS